MSVTRAAGGILSLLPRLKFRTYRSENYFVLCHVHTTRKDHFKSAGPKPGIYILPPLLPSSAVSGSLGSLGLVGLEGLPDPAAPPLLINTKVPEMATPAGPMLMKLPEAMMVSSKPASMTMFIPALRWISIPAS